MENNGFGCFENCGEKNYLDSPLHTAYSGQIWARRSILLTANGMYILPLTMAIIIRTVFMYWKMRPLILWMGTGFFKGKISDRSDNWAIDPSVFEYKNQWYMIWSGWEENKNGQQNIYIAKMKNPWTIGGKKSGNFPSSVLMGIAWRSEK
jgi:hypothetical protein